MSNKSQDEMITSEILGLFDETFENVQGYYLDKNSSLFERLNKISAQKASTALNNSEHTIASHVYHINFFLKTIMGYISGELEGKADWDKSWLIKEVSEEQWNIMKTDLMKTYLTVKEKIKSFTYWNDEDDFSGVISILVHSAFHMGAIWKMLEQIQASE